MLNHLSHNLHKTLQKLSTISLIANYKRMSLRSVSICSVRSHESDEKMIISFKYSDDLVKERFFHLKRNKNEELKQTFTRISLNINNLITKKINRKNKTKASVEMTKVSIDAKLLIDGKQVDEDLTNIEVWRQGFKRSLNCQ